MDTLTHALSGMLLARATGKKHANSNDKSQGLSLATRLSAGFLAAAFPDIDFIMRLDGVVSYLKYHRGLTHSVIMLPLWALVLSIVFMMLWRGRYHWRLFYPVCAMGLAIHIAGDVITAYGTMIWAPFSTVKAALPSTFIIDFYFSGIIVIALWAAWLLRQHARAIATTGLLCLTIYIGFQNYLAVQARHVANNYIKQQHLTEVNVHVLPQPASPFNWKIILVDGERYHVAYVNLFRENVLAAPATDANVFSKANTLYRPVNQLSWQVKQRFGNESNSKLIARTLWEEPALKDVRAFMLFPALSHMENHDKNTCAWFQDQRFVLDGIRAPFQFGVCRRAAERDWKLYRLRGGQKTPLFE